MFASQKTRRLPSTTESWLGNLPACAMLFEVTVPYTQLQTSKDCSSVSCKGDSHQGDMLQDADPGRQAALTHWRCCVCPTMEHRFMCYVWPSNMDMQITLSCCIQLTLQLIWFSIFSLTWTCWVHSVPIFWNMQVALGKRNKYHDRGECVHGIRPTVDGAHVGRKRRDGHPSDFCYDRGCRLRRSPPQSRMVPGLTSSG